MTRIRAIWYIVPLLLPSPITLVGKSERLWASYSQSIHLHTVKGKRRTGRQKKRWADTIEEWTGVDFASSSKAAEDRTRWKGVVVKSFVVL